MDSLLLRRAFVVSCCVAGAGLAGCYQSSPDRPKRECIPVNDLELGLPEEPTDEAARVAELARPFDADRSDTLGPDDRFAIFGKSPEIVALPDGDAIDVLLQSHADDGGAPALVLRLEAAGDDYTITSVLEPPVLDRILGFARDEDGSLYVASAIDESLDEAIAPSHPAPKAYRQGVVRLVKLTAEGELVFDVDVDRARLAADPGAAPLLDPMHHSTARLAYGGGRLALVHGIAGDARPDGTRDQRAATTVLDATTGDVLAASTLDAGASVDTRLVYGPDGLVEVHLGSTSSRGVALGVSERGGQAYPLLHAKGVAGDENVHARLGGIAVLEGDGPFGYLALVATERTAGTTPIHEGERYVAGARDLAVVRVRRGFADLDPSAGAYLDPAMPDRFEVDSNGVRQENRVRFLTDYHTIQGGSVHAERPKLVAIGSDRFIVLWERWELDPNAGNVFTGTWGMVIDAAGSILRAPTELTLHHLPRGDEAFALGGGAAFLVGDAPSSSLRLHRIDADLAHVEVIIE